MITSQEQYKNALIQLDYLISTGAANSDIDDLWMQIDVYENSNLELAQIVE